MQTRIEPHAATLSSLPEEGATIGYTGQAYYGEQFADHGYVSCPIVVGERTSHGCYAMTLDPQGVAAGEVFLLLDGSEEGRQQFHGYTLAPEKAMCRDCGAEIAGHLTRCEACGDIALDRAEGEVHG